MKPTVLPFTNAEEWHAIRAKTIGASEVAGLFNIEGAFNTRFELWVTKSGKLQREFEENERMFWGKKLEAAIAEGIAEKKGYTLHKPEGYFLHPTVPGMGCTPDFFVTHPDKPGRGVLEIKLVDYASFAKWSDGEPPLIYILQNQHQMACSATQWGAVGVLVNGNQLHVYEYERHPGTIRKLEKAVADFWLDVALNREPKAVAEDYEIIREYYGYAEGECLDLSDDDDLAEECIIALREGEKRRAAEKIEKAAKTAIIQKIQHSHYVRAPGFNISRNKNRLTIKEQVQ